MKKDDRIAHLLQQLRAACSQPMVNVSGKGLDEVGERQRREIL